MLLSLPHAVSAAEQQPWTHPDVLRAAVAMGLSDEQQPQFRDAVSQFLQNFGADVQRLMRRNNATGLPRKIATKRRKHVKIMDTRVGSFLSEEQFAAYEVYREALLEKMREQAAARRR